MPSSQSKDKVAENAPKMAKWISMKMPKNVCRSWAGQVRGLWGRAEPCFCLGKQSSRRQSNEQEQAGEQCSGDLGMKAQKPFLHGSFLVHGLVLCM